MAYPKLRNEGLTGAELLGENSGNAITSLACQAPPHALNKDLILIFVQATTNEAGKFPTISIETTAPVFELGELGKDEETAAQQTSRVFAVVNTAVTEGTMTATFIKTNEKCKIQIVTSAVVAGTYLSTEPIKFAGMRQSSGVGGAIPTPAVTGLTSTSEYLAIALFGYASGTAKTLEGWTSGAATGKYSVLYRDWTGITTTGEPAFTKNGPTIRALAGLAVVQPAPPAAVANAMMM